MFFLGGWGEKLNIIYLCFNQILFNLSPSVAQLSSAFDYLSSPAAADKLPSSSSSTSMTSSMYLLVSKICVAPPCSVDAHANFPA